MREFREALASAGMSTVVNVQVEGSGQDGGGTHPVLIERVALHPASGKVLHVDLHRVELNRPIRASVPFVLTGEAPGVQQGGVLMQTMDSLEVEALPRDLPHEITVDVSGLAEIDSQITLADVQLPSGTSTTADPEMLVVKVVASKLEQEVEAEVAEDAEAAQAAEEVAEEQEPEGAAETAPEAEATPPAESE